MYTYHHNTPEVRAALGCDCPEARHAGDVTAPFIAAHEDGRFFHFNNSTDGALKADYADLGVTTGYIGNIYHGPTRDDRSFRIFMRVATKPYQQMSDCSVHVFDVPRDHKGLWADPVVYDTPENRARLDAIREKVADGRLHLTMDKLRAVA
jgi:hypothetical protein